MPNKVIFSLDYDGCSDCLFDDTLMGNKIKTWEQSLLRFYGDKGKNLIEAFYKKFLNRRKALNKFLDEKASEAKAVEAYIGSLRQYAALDKQGHTQNENGLAFENIPKLCATKKWQFRPLLYADIANKLPPGTSLKIPSINCTVNRDKVAILHGQLRDILTNHPNPEDKIDLYFLDDDKHAEIFNALKNHFSKVNPMLPNNITVHLVQLNEDSLTEIAAIRGGLNRTLVASILNQLEERYRVSGFLSFFRDHRIMAILNECKKTKCHDDIIKIFVTQLKTLSIYKDKSLINFLSNLKNQIQGIPEKIFPMTAPPTEDIPLKKTYHCTIL